MDDTGVQNPEENLQDTSMQDRCDRKIVYLKALKHCLQLFLLIIIGCFLTLFLQHFLHNSSSQLDTSNYGNKLMWYTAGHIQSSTVSNNTQQIMDSKKFVSEGECNNSTCHLNRHRRNAATRAIITNFKKYEECLKAKSAQYELMYEKPTVILATERQPITLTCHLCLRPDHNPLEYKIDWQHFRCTQQNATWRSLLVDNEKYEVGEEGQLTIRRLTLEDAGRYVCYTYSQVFEAVYYMDVLVKEPTVQVFGEGIEGRRPQPDTILDKENLLIYSKWGTWTSCNRCNQRGQRMRHGTCMVKLLHLHGGTEYEILTKYPQGLPCRSSFLPTVLKQRTEVRQTPSENQLEYCYESCPTIPPTKEIRDENGNVVEVVHTGKGFISLRDKPPKIPPLVKRRTFYETKGTETILECPSDEVTHAAVRWQNNSQILDSVKLGQSADGRISIDVYNRLIIRHLGSWDTAVYSCWIDGRHIATIKIRVVGSTGSALSDKITIVGVGLSLALVVYIGVHVKKQHDRYSKALI